MKLPIEPDLWSRLIRGVPEDETRPFRLRGASVAVAQFVEDGLPLTAFCLNCARECMMTEAFEGRLIGALNGTFRNEPELDAHETKHPEFKQIRLGWMAGMMEIGRIAFDLGQQEAIVPLDLAADSTVVDQIYWVALSSHFFTEMTGVLEMLYEEVE